MEKQGKWKENLPKPENKKKQDEAHEPECRHVCWETQI